MKLTNTKRILGYNGKVLENRIKKGLKDKTDTGVLHNSIKVDYEADQNKLQIILTAEDYSYYVDQGRKPGIGMPVKPLKEWIKRKKLKVTDGSGKQVKLDDQKLDGLSYVINRKIREDGIEPTYFIERPVEQMLDVIGDRIAGAFAQDIDVELQNDI